MDSTPGAIKDLIVVATGASGVPVNTNITDMDDAYPTPSGTSGSTFFSMNKTAYGVSPDGNGFQVDPGGAGQFTGDGANNWDTTVAALQGFLGAGNTPVFFFNNNQVDSGASTNQNLTVWAQISLTPIADGPTVYFDFTNRGKNFTDPSLDAYYGTANCGVINGNPGVYTSSGSVAYCRHQSHHRLRARRRRHLPQRLRAV